MFRLNWEEIHFANKSTYSCQCGTGLSRVITWVGLGFRGGAAYILVLVEAVPISGLDCELADFITQPSGVPLTNRRTL